MGVFIAEIPQKTRSSRSPAPSWTCVRIGLGRVTKRRGGDVVGGAREKLPARKTHLLQIADFDFVSRRTRHFVWSINCQSSPVIGVTQRRSRSVRQIMLERKSSERWIFLESKDRDVVLNPEQSQAVTSLQNGEDALAVLPSGFEKSMIFTVFGIAEGEWPFIVCVVNLPVEKHTFGSDSATGRPLYCSRTHC